MANALLPAILAASRTDVGAWKWADLPPAWILTAVAIGLFFGLRALYRRERGGAGIAARLLLAGIRTGMFLLLLLVLAGPYREEIRTAEERSHLVILVDDSGSMATTDRYQPDEAKRLRDGLPEDARARGVDPDEATRLELVKAFLAAQDEPLLRKLDERFVVHTFAFDVDWRGIGATREDAASSDPLGMDTEDPVVRIADGIRALEGAGRGTDLGNVLRGVAAEFLGREDRRLAGVLLVSDGRSTTEGEGPIEVLTGLGEGRRDLHVTAVALGNPASGRNVRVERIRAMDWVLIEDDVIFETALRHQGFTGLEDVRARLTIHKVADAEGTPLEEPLLYEPPAGAVTEAEGLRLGMEDEPTPLLFQARMREPGTFRVTVEAELPPDAKKEDAIPDDDRAVHEIRVMDQRIKVLYAVNKRPWEFHFLGNWLTREPEADRTRPEQRRRYEAQTFQQTRAPTVEQVSSPGVDPLRSFPRTRRELFEYDVLILGDVDWMRLGDTAAESRQILGLIRDFVQEGGGIALQAGEGYKNPLDFRDTPLQDLLPISPRDRDENTSSKKDASFRIDLTDVGRRHPIFGIVPGDDGSIATADEVARVWRGESPFSYRWKWHWLYRATAGLRPGAVALARALPDGPLQRSFLDDTDRPVVVFALMNFGKGRVFWSAIDSVWRIRIGQGDRFYGRYWDQLIRHLATHRLLGGNKRFKITTDKEDYFAGETATITVTALDRDFEPMDDPELDGVHVEAPDGTDVLLVEDQRPLSMATEGAAPGTYRFYLPLRKKGTYRVWITDAEAGRGRALEDRAERRIEVEWRTPEKRQTVPDHDLLEAIVRETGGRLPDERLARLYDLPQLAEDLEARTTQRVIDRRERTQWDKPWVLLLLVGLLGIEWLLRKRWQMI